MKVKLYIENRNQSQVVELENELTIGRTPAAQLVLDDEGLSRVNTTIFAEGDELLVTDENSTNGTFLNGERISGRPKLLRNGDRLKIGTHTEIRVEIDDGSDAAAYSPAIAAPVSALSVPQARIPPPRPAAASRTDEPPYVLLAAIGLTLLILIGGGIALLIVRDGDKPSGSRSDGSRIPVRVVDLLGSGNDDQSLDDVLAAWETAEEELDTSTVADVQVMTSNVEETDLSVSRATFEEAKQKAFAARAGQGPAGVWPAGLNVPAELRIGFRNQTRKLAEMKSRGYEQPMDFADLAAKRLKGDLIEMPMAAQTYYLDVGGSAQDVPFTSFSFSGQQGESSLISPGHAKYDFLKRLADNFSGQRFDLENASDRREIRRRLLRMFQRRAKPILQKLAKTHFDKFGRPLRVTSLTRSIDYQVLLTKGNANAFRVSGAGSLPPHTSGCAFDLARKHMPVEEQNFLMQVLAEMEKAGELDALIEYGTNACFHIFIYDDGVPPR